MKPGERLPRSFFARPTLAVARDLLGMQLVRIDGGQRIAGIIVETEAYRGEEDLGCHARAGRTRRTAPMYGPPGHAYIYFTYGMHWLLNCVTEARDTPAAVLLRALRPTEGRAIIAQRRGAQPEARWTDGPAKICQALGIDGRLNGTDLCAAEAQLLLEYGAAPLRAADVTTGPRVGLNSVPEPWKSIPWRFMAAIQGPDGRAVEKEAEFDRVEKGR